MLAIPVLLVVLAAAVGWAVAAAVRHADEPVPEPEGHDSQVPAWAAEAFGPDVHHIEQSLQTVLAVEERRQRNEIAIALRDLITGSVPTTGAWADGPILRVRFTDGTVLVCAAKDRRAARWVALRASGAPAVLLSMDLQVPTSRLRFGMGGDSVEIAVSSIEMTCADPRR